MDLWLIFLIIVFFFLGFAFSMIRGRRLMMVLSDEIEQLKGHLHNVERLLSPHEGELRWSRSPNREPQLLPEDDNSPHDVLFEPEEYAFLEQSILFTNKRSVNQTMTQDHGIMVQPAFVEMVEHSLDEGAFVKGLFESGDDLHGSQQTSSEMARDSSHHGLDEIREAGKENFVGDTLDLHKFLTFFFWTWITLAVLTNLAAVISVLIDSTNLSVGMREVLSWYSPFNSSTWLGEFIIFAPAAGAYLFRERLRKKLK
jgi:hypothetical protein